MDVDGVVEKILAVTSGLVHMGNVFKICGRIIIRPAPETLK